MKHKKLIFGVALFLAAVVFFLLWLLSLWLQYSLWLAAFFSLCIFIICLFVPGRIYWRSTAALNRVCRLYAREHILYADIASLIENRREHTGALVVTRKRLIFDTPRTWRGKRWTLNYYFPEVALVKNNKDFFQMGAAGKEYVFKVFQCDYLVETIHACVEADAKARREEQEQKAAQVVRTQELLDALSRRRQLDLDRPEEA